MPGLFLPAPPGSGREQRSISRSPLHVFPGAPGDVDRGSSPLLRSLICMKLMAYPMITDCF